jgi:hypothetical protein
MLQILSADHHAHHYIINGVICSMGALTSEIDSTHLFKWAKKNKGQPRSYMEAQETNKYIYSYEGNSKSKVSYV